MVLAISEQLQQHFEQWVLDLGYSYHMCPHRHWVVTYEKKFGSNVLLGKDDPCKSISIGSIQIRMHHGVVRTLIEVCHVPKLKKNHVYVSLIDLKGFSCLVEGEVMQIRGKEK